MDNEKGKGKAPQSSLESLPPLSKNFVIKLYNKSKKFYEPYATFVQLPNMTYVLP